MREIRFRAWDLEDKKMYDVEDITFINIAYLPSILQVKLWDGENFIDRLAKMVILLQCIGAKDINGTEIYEGDIVRFTYHDRSVDFVVVFHGSAFVQEHCDKLDPADYEETKTIWYEWDEVEVVGNIHANPEMV